MPLKFIIFASFLFGVAHFGVIMIWGEITGSLDRGCCRIKQNWLWGKKLQQNPDESKPNGMDAKTPPSKFKKSLSYNI